MGLRHRSLLILRSSFVRAKGRSFVPAHRTSIASRAGAVKAGRRAWLAVGSGVARLRLDRAEHGARIMGRRTVKAMAYPTRFERVAFAFGGQWSSQAHFQPITQPTSATMLSSQTTLLRTKFAVSVVAYDSLPGHQCYDIPRFSTTLYDAAPAQERNAVRQLISFSTLRWRSLVTWRGLHSQNERLWNGRLWRKADLRTIDDQLRSRSSFKRMLQTEDGGG
jgi:hypothetical protein